MIETEKIKISGDIAEGDWCYVYAKATSEEHEIILAVLVTKEYKLPIGHTTEFVNLPVDQRSYPELITETKHEDWKNYKFTELIGYSIFNYTYDKDGILIAFHKEK